MLVFQCVQHTRTVLCSIVVICECIKSKLCTRRKKLHWMTGNWVMWLVLFRCQIYIKTSNILSIFGGKTRRPCLVWARSQSMLIVLIWSLIFSFFFSFHKEISYENKMYAHCPLIFFGCENCTINASKWSDLFRCEQIISVVKHIFFLVINQKRFVGNDFNSFLVPTKHHMINSVVCRCSRFRFVLFCFVFRGNYVFMNMNFSKFHASAGRLCLCYMCSFIANVCVYVTILCVFRCHSVS